MPKLLSTIKRYIGESGEVKAMDCPNGSTFLETDTGNMYVFWKETTADVGKWSLKDEANITLRLETKFLLSELLIEAKKSNENTELVIDSLSE